MSLDLRLFVITGLLITCVLTAETRRRSRIDSPIQIIPADSTFEDNLATASDVSEAVDVLPSTKEQKSEEATKEKDNSGESVSGECEENNISFELVTGYGIVV